MNAIQLQERVAELEHVLGIRHDDTIRLMRPLGLSRTRAQILGMLLSQKFISADAMWIAIHGGRPECDQPQTNSLQAQISGMRKSLGWFGVTITSLRGVGYSISDDDKAKIRAVVEGQP